MPHQHYLLYIDESGNFSETSTSKKERRGGQFASQCVGILVPAGNTNSFKTNKPQAIENRNYYNERIKELIQGAFTGAGYNRELRSIHGVDLTKGEKYEGMVRNVLMSLNNRNWQTVRLCNQRQIAFGTRVHNYLSMMAELLFQLLQKLSPNQSKAVFVEIIVDNWRKDIQNQIYLQPFEYENFFKQIFQHLCIHEGLDANHPNWKWSKPRTENAQTYPGLQLADLMSDASKNGFSKIQGNESLVNKIKEHMPIGVYDFELALQPLKQRLSGLLQQGSYGIALQVLTDALMDHTDEKGALLMKDEGILDLRDSCIHALKSMTPIARDSQLQVLQSWLYHTVQVERNQRLAQRRSIVIKKQVYEPLKDTIPAKALHGFQLWMYWLELTSYNHSGKLLEAHRLWSEFQTLITEFAGQYELSNTMVDVIIARAVHMNDCLDLDGAADSMKKISNHFKDVSEFMSLLHEQDVPRMRSFLRAQALGTWLQTMILKLAQGRARYEEALELSELAIDEFESDSDKRRQYQYRSQLEIVAGNGQKAIEWLAKSLDCEDPTKLAKTIKALPVKYQGFPLMHWMRIGAFAKGKTLEHWRQQTNDAQLWSCDYFNPDKGIGDYPVQNILRYAVRARLVEGKVKAAQKYQERLAGFCKNGVGMKVLHICAKAELKLLGNKGAGANNEIKQLLKELEEGFGTRETGLQRWLSELLVAEEDRKIERIRCYIL